MSTTAEAGSSERSWRSRPVPLQGPAGVISCETFHQKNVPISKYQGKNNIKNKNIIKYSQKGQFVSQKNALTYSGAIDLQFC